MHSYYVLDSELSSSHAFVNSYYRAAAAAKLLQLCSTLCNPIDGSPSGSAVPGILQARTLEWVAILSSRGSSQPRVQTQVSHIGVRLTSVPPEKPMNTGVGSLPFSRDLPNPGSPALQVDSLPAELPCC